MTERSSGQPDAGADGDHAATAAAPARRLLRVDRVVGLCALVLLAFPLAAAVLAARQPVQPAAVGALPSTGAPKPTPPVRDLPLVGRVAPTDPAALRDAVNEAIDGLFDERQTSRLRRYLTGGPIPAPTGVPSAFEGPPPYPYRYVGLDALVDAALPARPDRAQADAESRLGGLLALAEDGGVFRNAGQVAFAVLHRARATGACDAQLNLAFVVAASDVADRRDVDRELRGAVRACPHDPTALWLHGHWQSLEVAGEEQGSARSLSTFARLRRAFPGSAAGWSGKADVLLRLAYLADARQPFTARSRFERALALYRRARSLDPAPELGAGEARALAGLGRFAEAVRVQERAAAATGRPAALQARLVEYLERRGRFAQAAREGRRLAARPRFPSGPALTLMTFFPPDALAAEDALEPLSLGAGRLKPVSLDIAPQHSPATAGGPGPVEDLSFIPRFREVTGVTGIARWCPEWSARRDLVIAGRPGAALSGLPAAFRAIRPRPAEGECAEFDVRLLAAVAHAEAGDRPRAVAAMREVEELGARPRAALYDVRQNLWRFAGRWRAAAKVTAEWVRAAPLDPLAADQAGEVAFLAGDHLTAARLFARSAALSREQTAGWSVAEAQDLVKQGAALKRAGRYAQALDVLGTAADVAARAFASGADSGPEPRFGEPDDARGALYHAHMQTADVLLRLDRFADAAEEYVAARRHATVAGQELQLPEVLDNNEAVEEIYRGNPDVGRRLALRAVAVDPLNPLFLQTEGFALAHLGEPARAAWWYGRAVASDPSLYPAWNDLGVMLERSGRDDDAVAALRRAVAVRPAYATAWFNLGVVLERRGPASALAAQGALGRAFRLDPDFAKRKHELVTDERLYFTNLDLSKALPPEWDFASSQQKSPLPATGVALLLLLGLQGARAAGGRALPGGASKWLEAARDLLARLPRALSSLAPASVAVAATLAVFLWPAIKGGDGVAGLTLLTIGLIALVTLIMRARVLAARRLGVTLRQRGWRPALAVAFLAGALVGIPWAPLPVAETDRPEPRLHLVGPVVAAASGLVLLILSAWLEIPVTRSLGIAAIVMSASMLTPVKPLDGARMQGAAGAVTAGLALGGTALLVALGLL